MGHRIRLAIFDNSSDRRTALVQVLHISGRYHVPFHHNSVPAIAAALPFAVVDGALLAVGENTRNEQDLLSVLRAQLGTRPILAYALNFCACGVFRRSSNQTEARRNRCRLDACLGPFADNDDFVQSLDQCLEVSHSGVVRICDSDHLSHNPECLSPREKQILGLLGEGRSFKAMAPDIGISLNTVYTHAKRIRAKFHLTGNVELLSGQKQQQVPILGSEKSMTGLKHTLQATHAISLQ